MKTMLTMLALFLSAALAVGEDKKPFDLDFDSLWSSRQPRSWGTIDFKNGTFMDGKGKIAIVGKRWNPGHGVNGSYLYWGTWTSENSSGQFYIYFTSPDYFAGDYTTGSQEFDHENPGKFPNWSGVRIKKKK